MEKKRWATVFLFSVITLSWAFCRESGHLDYRREESPVISWNPLALFDTRCLSLAGISLFASSPSSQYLNPAYIAKRGMHAGGSLNFLGYQSFQYWGVNQGVIQSYQPLSEKKLNSGSLFFQASFRGWAVSAGYISGTPFLFPDFSRRVDYEDSQYYEISGEFSSRSHDFFTALAFSLSPRVSGGVSVIHSRAERGVVQEEVESFLFPGEAGPVVKRLVLSRREIHQRRTWRFHGGFVWRFGEEFQTGGYLDIPLNGRVVRGTEFCFENAVDEIRNVIPADATDGLHLPVGVHWAMSTNFGLFGHRVRMGLEVDYRLWSTYLYRKFGREVERDLRNTLRTKLGLEYAFTGIRSGEFLRLGIQRDPQPPRDPRAGLTAVSLGAGYKTLVFTLDFGFSFYFTGGMETNQEHFTGAVTLHFHW